MRAKDEMLERYYALKNKALMSKDEKKMKVLEKAEEWVFMDMVNTAPEKADKWLDHLEEINWNNYLSSKEAMNIGRRMKNSDGTVGFHWNHEVFTNAVRGLGGKVEEEPYYNSYALCVTANMIYSDLGESIAEDMGYKTAAEVPNDKMALSCYKKAVSYLKDKDENFRIRKYFKNRMYDNSPI